MPQPFVRMSKSLVPLVGLILAVVQASAAQTSPLALHRVASPIQIDGRIEEAEWGTVPLLPLETWEPVAGQPPSEHTEIRVAYDDAY
ncbi:MAG TPA: hypothetical protein VFZ18_13490, partial [Longimicrobiaceae bacterium]